MLWWIKLCVCLCVGVCVCVCVCVCVKRTLPGCPSHLAPQRAARTRGHRTIWGRFRSTWMGELWYRRMFLRRGPATITRIGFIRRERPRYLWHEYIWQGAPSSFKLVGWHDDFVGEEETAHPGRDEVAGRSIMGRWSRGDGTRYDVIHSWSRIRPWSRIIRSRSRTHSWYRAPSRDRRRRLTALRDAASRFANSTARVPWIRFTSTFRIVPSTTGGGKSTG